MRATPRTIGLAAILIAGVPAAARPTGAPASTMRTGHADTAGPPRGQPVPQDWREAEVAQILSITPRPRLSADCSPAQERAARSDLERAQYRLKCRE